MQRTKQQLIELNDSSCNVCAREEKVKSGLDFKNKNKTINTFIRTENIHRIS